MAEAISIPQEDLRKMQLLQLDMIVEFDRVCRKHNIKYVIAYGTLLGAVRHQGYIPWDDDSDLAMLREDYEKFKKVAHELNPEICFFQDHTTEKEYIWNIGKLRRTGTTYVRAGQEHLKFKTGVFVDIFPIDNFPENKALMVLEDFNCFVLRKILYSQVAKENTKGFEKIVYTALSNIKPSFAFKRLEKKSKKYQNSSRGRVYTFPSNGKLYKATPFKNRYSIPKVWITERKEYLFEGHKLYGTKDYDGFLKCWYNDYMTIPDKEHQEQHASVSSYSLL